MTRDYCTKQQGLNTSLTISNYNTYISNSNLKITSDSNLLYHTTSNESNILYNHLKTDSNILNNRIYTESNALYQVINNEIKNSVNSNDLIVNNAFTFSDKLASNNNNLNIKYPLSLSPVQGDVFLSDCIY